jgi:PAS domain S-box-containing protein
MAEKGEWGKHCHEVALSKDEMDGSLRGREKWFRGFFEAAPTAVVITDRDGQVVLVNAKAEEMFGYDRGQLLGKPIEILVPERLWSVHRDYCAGFFADPHTRSMGTGLTLTGRRKNGTEFPVEIGLSTTIVGDQILAISVVSDVSDRNRAEEEIRKLSRAVEQSPSILMITDTYGKIEFVNPKFTEVTGYTADEVTGKNPRILKSGLQSAEFYADLWQKIAAGGEWRGEVCNRKKDGERYWELASISPIRDTEGNTTHFLKLAEDITERKRVEEALRRYAAELESQNAELDAFAHTVAHDLRNPLSLVVGLAEALEEDYDSISGDELRIYLHRIAQVGRRMSNIVDELLLLATVRKTDVAGKALDMEGILFETQQRLRDMIEKYQAEIVLPSAWPVAIGYGPWVGEVWVNYISNAIKYGGRPPRVELGAETHSDGMVLFWVRDNGPGLSPGEQAQLFAPFTRLAQSRAEGHGLGLSIVRRIVEKLGGEVGMQSEGLPGEGSVFSFTLPRYRSS